MHTYVSRVKKPRTRGGKVPLQVYIPQELYYRLITVAPKVYGRTKGALSALVEEAVREYLARVGTQERVGE